MPKPPNHIAPAPGDRLPAKKLRWLNRPRDWKGAAKAFFSIIHHFANFGNYLTIY